MGKKLVCIAFSCCARWIEGEEINIVWPAERSETMLNPRTCSLSWPEEIDGEEVSVVNSETDDQTGRTGVAETALLSSSSEDGGVCLVCLECQTVPSS